MRIIVNNSSMVPIYEQLVEQIKNMIVNKELVENEGLPSVRALAKELKISALTVKKAYDILEEEGLTITVHGKGTYVAVANTERMMEEYRKEIEKELDQTVNKGKRYGLVEEEVRALFEMIMEEW